MGLGSRHKSDDDEATDSLLMGGVYRLAEWGGYGKKKGNDAKYPYSFLGALKYAFLLIFLLWWLPLVGPMVAGYVTGRRAGRPWLGVAATGISLIVLTLVAMLLGSGTLGTRFSMGSVMEWAVATSPAFEPYFQFAQNYIELYIGAATMETGLHLDLYILALAFSYIGGAMGLQSWREISYASKNGGNKMTVMMNAPTRRERGSLHIFHDRKEKRPTKASVRAAPRSTRALASFADLEEMNNEEDEIRSPVDRGIDDAQIDFIKPAMHRKSTLMSKRSTTMLHRNAPAKKPSHHQAQRAAEASGEENLDPNDWRFI